MPNGKITPFLQAQISSSSRPDFVSQLISAMRATGLDVYAESLVANGQIQRCRLLDGNSGKKSGAYKIFTDDVGAWWQNWRTNEWNVLFERQNLKTKAEREARNARLARAREESERLREKQWATTAGTARRLLEKGKPATAEHAYLARKKLPPLGLKVDAKGVLLVPVQDMRGEILSLQRIFPHKLPDIGTDKLFLSGGKTSGGFFRMPAREGAGVALLLAEGFATAAALHISTGLETFACFSANNLEKVALQAREKWPERQLAICADYDKPHEQHPEPGGTGVALAKKAAEAACAHLAVCPPGEHEKFDFCDLYGEQGTDAVLEAIEAALAAEPASSAQLPPGFTLIRKGAQAGLYFMEKGKAGEAHEVWLGEPLEIVADAHDAQGNNWGRLVRFQDPDGRMREQVLASADLYDFRGPWLSTLAANGWRANHEKRAAILTCLTRAQPVLKVISTSRTGWTGESYVLPDAVYGPATRRGSQRIILQAQEARSLYQCGGAFEEWQAIAALCEGNSRLAFALAVAFAGPLLRLCGIEGGGFSFTGASSTGKTAALELAASVWGDKSHVHAWRATANGLEILASLHNDNLLILDELGQGSASAVNAGVYLLSNGQGIAAAKRNGAMRETRSWRVIFLSSGEIGLVDKLAEDGKRPRAGQDARFVGIPTDREDIQNLHGMPDGGALIRRIKSQTREHYGHAGRAFLEALTQPETLARIKGAMPEAVEKKALELCPEDADGQVQRVAIRFSLVGYAGALAKTFRIIPKEVNFMEAAKACFEAWLERRGGAGPAEDTAIVRDVAAFLEKHGEARFVDLDRRRKAEGRYAGEGAPEIPPCPNRAGFRETGEDGRTAFYIQPETFRREIVAGHDPKRAAQALAEAGWLERPRNEYGFQTQKKLPDLGNQRVYKLTPPENYAGED